MRLRIASMIAVTAAVVSTSAVAADLPAKAPPYVPPAPVWNWSGFYIGGHVGAAFRGDDSFSTDVFGLGGGNNDAAFMGGGQVGADYQFGSNWVIGIEAQISGISSGDRTFFDGFTRHGGTPPAVAKQPRRKAQAATRIASPTTQNRTQGACSAENT